MTTAATLQQKHNEALFVSLCEVMQEAIEKRGTSMSDYLDVNGNPGVFQKYLWVYQRAGSLCKTCGVHVIERTKIAGRSSHYCPNCQPNLAP